MADLATIIRDYDKSNGLIQVSPSKCTVMAGWDHVPHLTEQAKKELYDSTPPYLREARSKGIPSLGAGAIYPISENDIKVSDFVIPRFWPVFYGLDVGWNATASVWFAYDRENDVLYIYRVYKRGQAEPAVHSKAIKGPGEWIPGTIDPAARGRSQKDGERLMSLYEDEGLDLTIADNSVESGIYEVYERLTTGRLKIFASCVGWFEEYRLYRRDEDGKIVKKFDHLMDGTRYGVATGISIAKAKAHAVRSWREKLQAAGRNSRPKGAMSS